MALTDIQWLALLTTVLLFNLQCLNNSFVQACGGNFTGSSGVITSPSYPQSYQANLTCVYTITQAQGLPIALVFEDFYTEGNSDCTYDYVEIRDGNSATSSLLTPRICGSVRPPVLCSTQRYMRLLFRTDYSFEHIGFRATFSVCGGNFTVSSGMIQSPSYPNNYSNNIDYSYVINQTDGYFINLNFSDFSLQTSSSCTLDYVEIRNGGTFVSPTLGSRLCGSLLPPVQRTTTNLMWIRFKTDGAVVFKGFQASYTTCGGRFTSSSGVLISPSYPSSYPNNMDCSYVISQPSGYFVFLKFTNFVLQSSVNCASDFIEIRNGGSSVSPILGTRLCGSQLPSVQTTTQNMMWIRLKTDNSGTYSGFRASYTTCGGYFNFQYGTMHSPSYPSNYENNLDCFYVISQTAGYFVGLTFTDFYLEGGGGCLSDYIEIRDGSTQTSPQISSRFCGSTIPPFLKSSQGSMSIRFRSNGSGVYKGFQASYTNCGGRFAYSSGVLTSPSYPSSYPNNMDCTYVISQSNGYFVALIFTVFQLPPSVNCTIDFIEIRDGGTQTSTQIGSKFCGSTIPPFLKSSQGSMSIRFRSNRSGGYTGFQANYTTCGGMFTSAQGYIQSPSYPSTYHSNMDCVYVISVPAVYHITVSFSSFDLQGGSNCSNDYVEIRDGGSQTSPILGQRSCGTTTPPTQTTSQHLAWIHFKSDNSINYQGFQLFYTSSCGQTYSLKQGVIQSPFFPSNYPNNIDCVYVINQQSGYRIQLNFTDFVLQSGSGCLDDYVEVRDGGSSTSPLIGNRFCGSSIPPSLSSTQNVMRIRFRTNIDSSYKGFRALYGVACESVFTAQQSTVSSPSTTVNNYLSSQQCIYVITQPQGYRVTLNFTRFYTASGINCTSDYVEVLDGESPSSPILGSRFCGVTLPPVQRSTQNTMSIRFKIEISSSNKGFQAVYTSEVILQEIILVTDDVSVIHMDLETRSYSHISTTSMQQPMGVDYDPVEDRVYWTDIARGEICSSRLNNTDFRMMHFLGKNSQPYGIAVDTVSRLIFYTEARNNTIGLLTISNLSHKLLVNTDLDEPRAITLDKLNGLMFWSQVGSTPKIERANYDASDRKTLVATSIIYPSAIAVDVESNQLFWTDPGTDTLECADLEGRNRRLIYRSPDRHFVGMELFGNHLYLTDWGQLGPNSTSSYVRRMEKNGHNDIIFATFPGHLHNVHIYSERSQHPVTSTCARSNGNCSRICIPAPNNATICMCPDGESLSMDRKECFLGEIIESDSSAGTRIVIGAASGAVLILIIIASLIGVVIFKRRKGQRTDNQCRNLQMRESTYDGINLRENRTSSAEIESDQYDVIEPHKTGKHQIDNPTYMNSDNIYANQVMDAPIYANNEATA